MGLVAPVLPGKAEFLVRPEHDGDPRLVHNDAQVDSRSADQRPWWRSRPRAPRRTPLRCAGGPKRLLDFEAGRARARTAADSGWDAFAALVASHPPAESVSRLIARHHDDPDPRTAAKAEHLAQPLMQAIAQRALRRNDPHFGMFFLTNDPIEHFGEDKAAFVHRAGAHYLVTYALITVDGTWMDQNNDDPAQPFPIQMDDYLMALDDDAYVLRVLCHN